MKKTVIAIVASTLLTGTALAADNCEKTLETGMLTIATGNPAYFPWVMNDKPESKEGFEAAVAYEVAGRMGYADDKVKWVRASFDQSIQPGPKNFDFNLQQFSITEEREKVVDFSKPYYSASQAVLVRKATVDGGAKPVIDSLKGLKWGVMATTTALQIVTKTITPSSDPLLYNDNNDVVAAMKANQIEAALFDLPTALYLSAVVLDDGALLGQFPPEQAANPDQFGLLMEEGNALKECVNKAIDAITADGTLAKIEATWLQQTTGVPVIK